MGLELLVNVAQLIAAAAKIESAENTYREAVASVQSAAQELAANWEGDGQVAFVADQEQAYKWYIALADVVREVITVARKVAQVYQETSATLASRL